MRISDWSSDGCSSDLCFALGTTGAGAQGDGPGPAQPLQAAVDGANGEGRIETPGRTCAEGGTGAYWNYDYSAPLAQGAFSDQPGDLRLHLALHSDSVRFPNPEVPVLAEDRKHTRLNSRQ